MDKEVVFGFTATDIDQLAKELSQILKIHLYAHLSPMIGRWYSSENLNTAAKALREANHEEIRRIIVSLNTNNNHYTLMLNDPEPGYSSPEFPDGGDYLLRVSVKSPELKQIENKLLHSSLTCKRLDKTK